MPRYTLTELQEAASASDSYAGTLRYLGLCQTGGNNKVLRKWMEEWSVDFSHFLSQKDRSLQMHKDGRLGFGAARPIGEFLIEGRLINNTHLKKRLYKEGYKIPFCELCGQGEMWRGKHMSMILDHINGIHDDNRIKNLRIVCPNCNSTLDTHCGKHNKKPKPPDRRRNSNPRPERRKVQRPSYEILLYELEKSNFVQVGKRYGVSDNAVRKWINSYRNSSV